MDKVPQGVHIIKDFELFVSKRFRLKKRYSARYDCITRKLEISLDYKKEDTVVNWINLETLIEMSCHLGDMGGHGLMCKQPQHKGIEKCPMKSIIKKILD